MNRLKVLSGNDYDKTYVKHMVKDHEKDLKAFQKATENVDDPDLKAFASKGANMIAGHLQRAKDLESSLTKNK